MTNLHDDHTEPHLRAVPTPVPRLDDAPPFPDDFDPDAVPRFPLIVLEVSPASPPQAYVFPYQVSMDGQPVPIPEPHQHHQDPDQGGEGGDEATGGGETGPVVDGAAAREYAFAVAVAAASRAIAARGWDAARVNAVDPDGQRWPMVLGADGERYDLTEARVLPRKHRWLPLAAAATAVVLSAGTVGTVLALHTPAAPTAPLVTATAPPSSVAPPAAQPAEYPVLPPVGFTTHARWAYGPLAATDAYVQTPSGQLLARTADQFALIDPATGIPAWIAAVTDDTTGPWVDTIAGQPVVVTGISINTTLTWRPLADLSQAHTVPINDGAMLTPMAGGLLLSGPQQNVGLLTPDDTVTNRLVPAGAKAVGVDGLTVIASNGRQLWLLDRDQPQTPNPVTLMPPGKGARPSTDAIWRAGRLLTFWTLPGLTSAGTERTVATLHDRTGRLVKTIPVQAQLAATDQGKTPDPRYTQLSDGTVVDHTAGTLIPVPPGWQGTTLVAGDLYGTSNGRPARYTLATRKLLISPASEAADPLGRLGPDALARADRPDGPTLYRLQPPG